MEAVATLSMDIGIKSACKSLLIPRSGFYRIKARQATSFVLPRKRPSPNRALSSEERQGVPEYWIIDPELELVKIYRLTDGRYGRAEERAQKRGETVTTALLPGLTIFFNGITRVGAVREPPLQRQEQVVTRRKGTASRAHVTVGRGICM